VNPVASRAFVTRLTADGVGAIAVIRVWGPGAIAVASRVFRPRKGSAFLGTSPGRMRLGRMGDGIGDDVIALIVPAEHLGLSEEVEVQCHGGPVAVEIVIQALLEAGGIKRSPRAWLARLGLSPIGLAARFDLPRATTLLTARILSEQAEGALETELRQTLTNLRAANSEEAARLLYTLLERGKLGVRLIAGWRVALAGRPNVGKSSILNALAGFHRAIVSPEPGTTRDVITIRTALGGWPVEVADTAGIRPTTHPIEAAGVAMARDRHRIADLVMLILDRSVPLSPIDLEMISKYRDALIIVNKCDLPAAWEVVSALGNGAFLEVSATQGEGISRLSEDLASRLVPTGLPGGAGLPWRRAQIRWLTRALADLRAGRFDSARQRIERLIRPIALFEGRPSLSSESTVSVCEPGT
jgi:tRNA modification GTPase